MKIIGYKLIETKFEYTVLQIIGTVWGNPKYIITVDSCIEKLRNAKLLDIWFEPVYYEEFIKENNMCTEKTIKLSLEQARKMYGKNPEMDELLLANFSKEELTKKELPKSWNELSEVSGFYIKNSNYKFEKIGHCGLVKPTQSFRDVFATEKQAKSAIAMAQLSQLIAVYNDGWEADWNNGQQVKYIIRKQKCAIHVTYFHDVYHFLAFKTPELRDEFLKNFEPLIKEYFMID